MTPLPTSGILEGRIDLNAAPIGFCLLKAGLGPPGHGSFVGPHVQDEGGTCFVAQVSSEITVMLTAQRDLVCQIDGNELPLKKISSFFPLNRTTSHVDSN
jgi:hypothetical protein